MSKYSTIGKSKIYISPKISIFEVELEASIAAGSAKVFPMGNNGDYQMDEKWTEDNFTQDVSW